MRQNNYDEDTLYNGYTDKEQFEETAEETETELLTDSDDDDEEGEDEEVKEKKQKEIEGFINGENLTFRRRYVNQEDLINIMNDYKSGDADRINSAYIAMCEVLSPYVTSLITSNYYNYIARHGKDMRQCAFLGIMEGMQTYDPLSGAPTTWFSIYIKHELQEYINGLGGTTSHYAMAKKKIKAVMKKHSDLGIECTIEDIIIETGLSIKTVNKILQTDTANNTVSFQTNSCLVTSLHSNEAQPEDAYLEKEQNEMLLDYISGETLREDLKLSEDEQHCVLYMYGFNDGEKHTLIDTARTYGWSERDARKILASSLKKLKKRIKKEKTYPEMQTERKYKGVNRISDDEMDNNINVLLNDDSI